MLILNPDFSMPDLGSRIQEEKYYLFDSLKLKKIVNISFFTGTEKDFGKLGIFYF
jgi:hypothetical protein